MKLREWILGENPEVLRLRAENEALWAALEAAHAELTAVHLERLLEMVEIPLVTTTSAFGPQVAEA